MEISRTSLIIIGCIAVVLLIALLVLLALRFYKYWINRKNTKYHLLSDEDSRTKLSSRSFQPKFHATFPTSALQTQFIETRLDEYLADEDKYRQSKERQRQKQNEKQRADETKVREKTSRDSDKKKMFSDSDMPSVHYDNSLKLIRTKSEPNRGAFNTPKRARGRSALQVVPEISGQIEYSILLDSANRSLEIDLVQLIDINEISADMFKNHFPVYDMNEAPSSGGTPYLQRGRNKQITFSDPEQLGFYVEVMKFPKKEHICTTDYKYGMQDTSLNEKFRSDFADPEQFINSVLRLQVLLRYGKHPQKPTILGETILPLKKCTDGSWSLFRDELRYPVNETELESIAMEYSSIGKMVVSVSYQLLHQHLTVRICEANYNDRIGIQSPSTSVKVGIYLGESCAFKETTEVVRKSLDPQFGKSFDFKLPHDKLQNAAILLEVQQHGYVHKSTIGYVHIGLKASKRGRNYWKEVVGFSDFNRECFLDIQRVKPSKIC